MSNEEKEEIHRRIQVGLSLRKTLSDALLLAARTHLIAEIRLVGQEFEIDLFKRGSGEQVPSTGEIRKTIVVLNYEEKPNET